MTLEAVCGDSGATGWNGMSLGPWMTVWKRIILEEKLYPIMGAPHKTTAGMWGGKNGVEDKEDVIDAMTKDQMVKAVVAEVRGKILLLR